MSTFRNESHIFAVIPFYKGNAYLPQLFRLLQDNAEALRNGFPGYTLTAIFVNDSPEYPMQFPTMLVDFECVALEMPVNSGIHAARARGLSACKNGLVLFLDQDDIIAPDYFARQLEYLSEGEAVLCNAGIEEADGSCRALYQSRYEMERVNDKRIYLYSHNIIKSPGQCLIRIECIPEAWRNVRLERNGSDDLLLWLMLLEKGFRFRLNPEQLYIHKYTGKNLSAAGDEMSRSTVEAAELLRRTGAAPEKDLKILERSREFGIRFNESGAAKKLLLAVKNADIVIPRILWKFRSVLSRMRKHDF
ncbi:MAG: glycosyltransferase [Lachnospiraceae bacterium]|nr:glycosyltransferase [Lachnospiraceae bacterium]